MQINVNGKSKEVIDDLSVSALINSLNLQADQVVVELNRSILTSEQFSTAQLTAGDSLEIVQFVGGG